MSNWTTVFKIKFKIFNPLRNFSARLSLVAIALKPRLFIHYWYVRNSMWNFWTFANLWFALCRKFSLSIKIAKISEHARKSLICDIFSRRNLVCDMRVSSDIASEASFASHANSLTGPSNFASVTLRCEWTRFTRSQLTVAKQRIEFFLYVTKEVSKN